MSSMLRASIAALSSTIFKVVSSEKPFERPRLIASSARMPKLILLTPY